MVVYKPRLPHALLTLMPLCACGLEGDYAHFKDVAQANTHSSGDGTSSSSSSIPDEPASTTAFEDSGDAPDATTALWTSSTGETGLSSAGESATTGDIPRCGDRSVDPEEECDDPDDPACHDCLIDRLVFVTSERVAGDFAKSADLDYLCNHLADLAGLLVDHQPRFLPWISTSFGGARDRLHHARGRYVLRNGAVLAANWEALVAGELQNRPNIDEMGNVFNVSVWTGTRPDGTAMPASSHCDDWSAGGFDASAGWGYSDRIDSEWTQWADGAVNPTTCGGSQSLYCFEQP